MLLDTATPETGPSRVQEVVALIKKVARELRDVPSQHPVASAKRSVWPRSKPTHSGH